MTDRTTKALLLAIALGLWMNVAGQWLRPVPLQAQGNASMAFMASMATDVSRIALTVNAIALGQCLNDKIC